MDINNRVISPIPYVNLNRPKIINDGFFIESPKCCIRRMETNDEKCLNHYLELQQSNNSDLKQCPYGFSSKLIKTKREKVAITALIPYPRMGGENERMLAKVHIKNKFSLDKLEEIAKKFQNTEELLESLEKIALENFANALHEIKKLNRTVKQNSERICRKESSNPLNADSDLVAIWKSSEIMSQQFDIFRILANETILDLPRNKKKNIYKLFDKCVRILQHRYEDISINSSEYAYEPMVKVCENTFTAIPTVLISNAIKYAKKGTYIEVVFDKADAICSIKVKNIAIGKIELGQDIYEKGVRCSSDDEGSGYGLYLAQRIAAQHNTKISHKVSPFKGDSMIEFSISFITL